MLHPAAAVPASLQCPNPTNSKLPLQEVTPVLPSLSTSDAWHTFPATTPPPRKMSHDACCCLVPHLQWSVSQHFLELHVTEWVALQQLIHNLVQHLSLLACGNSNERGTNQQ
jgi:hypothetical protein